METIPELTSETKKLFHSVSMKSRGGGGQGEQFKFIESKYSMKKLGNFLFHNDAEKADFCSLFFSKEETAVFLFKSLLEILEILDPFLR